MPIGVKRVSAVGAARKKDAASDLSEPELSLVTALFRTLCDPTRLRLLSLLADGERCVHELCAATGMSQPAVSHQLRLLRVARLVRGARVGREVRYVLDDEHVMELVAQARSHVGHLGAATKRPPAKRHAVGAKRSRPNGAGDRP